MRVKEESAKVGLKLNIKKTKMMASSPSWKIEGEEMKVVTDFIFLGSKITPDGTEALSHVALLSDTENWFCECSALYSGKLCQFSNCEKNPCGNGATCFPKSNQDTVCLCPYGRTGILCNEAVNITYPNFSGTDSFGFTSFLAYSAIPNISLYYEFHVKFQLAKHNSSLEDNLIFFTGQKGQGKLFELVLLPLPPLPLHAATGK
ncbi:hypothetical protein EYD10_06927 [Varanus komodoensis]|nr:hypothetical protein EYD10_06927 [Varanus komodoensis]